MNALARYDQARQALAACRSVDEIKDIRDKSEAMRLYAKQAQDTELEQWAAEIKLRAQRAIGELSAALETQKGGFGIVPTGGKHKAEVLAEAGISTSTANRYEKLAAIPEPVIEEVIAKSREAGKPVSAKVVMAQVAPKPAPRAPAAPMPTASAWPFPNASPGSPAAAYNSSLEAVPGPAVGEEDADELYDQAVAVVLANRRASISLVQRHLRIGYNRAARLLEQMESAGVVSAMQANGNRDILTPCEPAPAAPPSLVQQVMDQQAGADTPPPADDELAPEPDPFEQLESDYHALQRQHVDALAQIDALEQRIATLTSDNLAAQVDALALKCAQLDSLSTSRFNETLELKKMLDGQRGFLDQLRRFAGLPKGGDLAAWIRAAAQRAA